LKSLPLRAADFPPDPSSAPVAPCSSMKTSLGSLARGACGRMGEVSALAPQNVPRGRDLGFSAGAGFVLRSLPVCLPRHSILPGSSSRRTRAEWPQAPGLERGLAGTPRTARAPPGRFTKRDAWVIKEPEGFTSARQASSLADSVPNWNRRNLLGFCCTPGLALTPRRAGRSLGRRGMYRPEPPRSEEDPWQARCRAPARGRAFPRPRASSGRKARARRVVPRARTVERSRLANATRRSAPRVEQRREAGKSTGMRALWRGGQGAICVEICAFENGQHGH